MFAKDGFTRAACETGSELLDPGQEWQEYVAAARAYARVQCRGTRAERRETAARAEAAWRRLDMLTLERVDTAFRKAVRLAAQWAE